MERRETEQRRMVYIQRRDQKGRFLPRKGCSLPNWTPVPRFGLVEFIATVVGTTMVCLSFIA